MYILNCKIFLTSLWKSMALPLVLWTKSRTWTVPSGRWLKSWKSHLLPEKAQKASLGYPQQLHCGSCICISFIPHHIAFSTCGTLDSSIPPIDHSSCLLPSVCFCEIQSFLGQCVLLSFLSPFSSMHSSKILLCSVLLVKVILIISTSAKNVYIRLDWFIYQEFRHVAIL
jgi:hypothetical protein